VEITVGSCRADPDTTCPEGFGRLPLDPLRGSGVDEGCIEGILEVVEVVSLTAWRLSHDAPGEIHNHDATAS
jgi:hypothetical protein